MAYVDFMSPLHKATTRDYLARVNDPEFPKPKAAELAKRFDYDYWDGDRRVCYGGYRYMPGRWEKVARMMADWDKQHPGRTETIAKALSDVRPSQLADPGAFDFATLGRLSTLPLPDAHAWLAGEPEPSSDLDP